MFKVQPWMLGVGVVALGGVGIAIYEVVQSKKTPLAPAALPAAATGPQTAAQVPVLPATRPNPPAVNSVFGSTAYPIGPVVTMAPAATVAVSPASGQSITLVLPVGGKWVGVVVGNQTNPNIAVGQVQLGSNLTSPVSLPVNSLTGGNAIMAVWTDITGVKRYTYVSFPTIVSVKALHF